MQNGWGKYQDIEYYITARPLNNGNRQQLVMGAIRDTKNAFFIVMAVCSSNATFHSFWESDVLTEVASTNKNPSVKTLRLALSCLEEIENAIADNLNEKHKLDRIYIDGLNYQRLHVYQRFLVNDKYGYKISKIESDWKASRSLHKIYKTIKFNG